MEFESSSSSDPPPPPSKAPRTGSSDTTARKRGPKNMASGSKPMESSQSDGTDGGTSSQHAELKHKRRSPEVIGPLPGPALRDDQERKLRYAPRPTARMNPDALQHPIQLTPRQRIPVEAQAAYLAKYRDEFETMWTTMLAGKLNVSPPGLMRPDAVDRHCWVNAKLTLANGYPVVGYIETTNLAKQAGTLKAVYAHVVAAHVVNKETTAGDKAMQILHLCHNKLCFNPAHVKKGTAAMNTAQHGCLCCANLEETWWDLCPHDPKCIARDVANLPSGFSIESIDL